MVAWKTDDNKSVAVVAGARTPQAKAGTALKDTHAVELGRLVIQEALYRADCSAEDLDEVILGNVVMPADSSNPARVAALFAGVPESVPAMTVQRNCASGIEAMAEAATHIRCGDAKTVMAGGVESMSRVPLLFPEQTNAPMERLAKARSIGQKLKAAMSLRPRHFAPVPGLLLGLTDPTCNMIMGKTAEKLAHEFGISREEQDTYALESHMRACQAVGCDSFKDEMMPVYPGRKHQPVAEDVGPRKDQTMKALGKLKPIFDRRDGTVTVGNACSITDGACAALIMDGEHAEAQGHDPLGYIAAYAYSGLDPTRMGLGPVFAIDELLRKTGHSLDDIGLIEINEAFAAQVLACRKAMSSVAFAREHLDRNDAVGDIDPEKLNVNGGAIALGHPVGATGARLVLTLLMEMRRRDVERGIAALCVGGGQGVAMLLERR